MLKFKSFLKETFIPQKEIWEQFLTEQKNNRDNDDMGKYHELRFLHHVVDEPRFPSHHRSEGKEDPLHNGDPKTVHDNIIGRMDPAKAEMYDRGAKDTAHEWRKQNLGPDEHAEEAFWTSNRDQLGKNGEQIPGDPFKTTGIHDPNQKADGIVKIRNKKTGAVRHAPVSLKIGKNDPNLANPGMDALEKMSGHDKGALNSMEGPHIEHAKSLGYHPDSRVERHAQWKADYIATTESEGGVEGLRKKISGLEEMRDKGQKLESKHKKYIEHGRNWLDTYDSLKPKDKEEMLAKAKHRMQSASDSSIQVRKSIAQRISAGLNSTVKTKADGTTDDSELRSRLMKSFAPSTVLPTSIAHSRISADGNSISPEVHNYEDYVKPHFDRFANLSVESKDGITSYVKGHVKDPKTGELLKDKNGKLKRMNVAQINVKNNDGPMNNIVGSMVLANHKSDA